METPPCFYCDQPAVITEMEVMSKGEALFACESCWARIGRWAIRFGAIGRGVGYFSEAPLTEKQIAVGIEIGKKFGLMIDEEGK